MRSLLVTGGAGFIGSEFVIQAVGRGDRVTVLDALTYAGHRSNLDSVSGHINFVKGDIRNRQLVGEILLMDRIDGVINFAAESHVDRSIASASEFVETNVLGVLSLLEASRAYVDRSQLTHFRFVQVSTDEVFGSLGETGHFKETTAYAPNSPYSASKAGGDHLVRAWFHTYGLPVIITNCSNNFGPRQFPEKLIPHIIQCALQGRPLTVYGDGRNVRDWIHVHDHAHGVWLAFDRGVPGESYCFGGRSERRNIQVVESICDELDRLRPLDGKSYRSLISFVEDRKGHDWRYAIDDSKSEKELGFTRKFDDFEHGLAQTVKWYLENQCWTENVLRTGRLAK